MFTPKFENEDRVLYEGKVYKVTDVRFFGILAKEYGYLLTSEEDGTETGCYIFEKYLKYAKEIPTEFTKSDLKPMDIVKIGKGKNYYMIFENRFAKQTGLSLYSNQGCFHHLDSYTDDLLFVNYDGKRYESQDITAIYRPTDKDMFLTVSAFFENKLNIVDFDWERKEEPKVKEVTASEASELLKSKFGEFDEVKIVL